MSGRAAADGHELVPDAELGVSPFDRCRHCSQPVELRDGRGIVAMATGSTECYGGQPWYGA